MFLSVVRTAAERDVQTLLHHLSNKLLDSFTDSHTSRRSKLALLAKLQWTTAPLAPRVVEAALEFLLEEPEPLVEVRAETAGVRAGRQLADATATCFCLNTPSTRARLLCVCTSVARDMVKAVHNRFVGRSKTFHLMDFDESFIAARESVACAVQDMDDRLQRAAYNRALHQLPTVKEPMVILNPTKKSHVLLHMLTMQKIK